MLKKTKEGRIIYGVFRNNRGSLFLNMVACGLFIFASTSLISLASFDRSGAFYQTIEVGDYYAVNKDFNNPIGSGFELTSNGFFEEVRHQFISTPVFSVQYDNLETNHAFFIEDERIEIDSCSMDYETFVDLGEPTSLEFEGDFYDFSLPVADWNYDHSGVYINETFLENYNSGSVEVRGGLGQINGLDSYFQDSIRYVSSTYARSKFFDDPSSFSIDNATVWFPFLTPYNEGATISFADFSDFDIPSVLNDKLVNMKDIFPESLTVNYSDHAGSFPTPMAVISDANFSKIVQKTHAYSSLAIKVTSENKKKVAAAMGSSLYKFSGNDRYFSFLMDYFITRETLKRYCIYGLIIIEGMFLFYTFFAGALFFQRNEKDFVNMRLLGMRPMKAYFLVSPSLMASTFTGGAIGTLCSWFFLMGLEASSHSVWFSEYQFSASAIFYFFIALLSFVFIFTMAFFTENRKIPYTSRIRGISK